MCYKYKINYKLFKIPYYSKVNMRYFLVRNSRKVKPNYALIKFILLYILITMSTIILKSRKQKKHKNKFVPYFYAFYKCLSTLNKL